MLMRRTFQKLSFFQFACLSQSANNQSNQGRARLQDRVAIVTGGSGAIGSEMVRSLVKEGAKVVIVDHKETEGTQLQNEVNKSNPSSTIFHRTDVTKESDIKSLVDTVTKKWGSIDILVNNAVSYVFGTIEETSSAEWDQALAVNVKGYAFMAKYIAPIMKQQFEKQQKESPEKQEKQMQQSKSEQQLKQQQQQWGRTKGGVIINVGSVNSFVASNAFVPYNTTKGAVLQMTRNLAMDLGPWNIRVNCLCPGFIDSPVTATHAEQYGKSKEELVKDAIKQTMLRRIGTTKDVADVLCFLVSDESSYITGASLLVDGGLCAH